MYSTYVVADLCPMLFVAAALYEQIGQEAKQDGQEADSDACRINDEYNLILK